MRKNNSRRLTLKSLTDSQTTAQEKKWIIILGIVALILIITLLILISINFFRSHSTTTPSLASADITTENITGNSRDFLPEITELPAGFQLVERNGGETRFNGGEMYELSYTNPDFLLQLQQREVNVLYTAAIFDNIDLAKQAYEKGSNADSYSAVQGLSTLREPFSLKDFTNVDEVALLFGEDVTELNTPSINYSLIFRYKNFMALTLISAPVDNYDSVYALQLRSVLKKNILYYSSLVTKNLPVHPKLKVELVQTTVVSPILNPTIPSSNSKQIIFEDNFQDSATTSIKWSPLGGSWVVENGVLRCIANGKYLANASIPSDFQFQLDMMGVDIVDKIIVFRATNDTRHYGIDFRSDPYNDIVLVKSLPDNIGKIIQTAPIRNFNNIWYTLKVDVVNNHIQVFVNDQLLIDYTDVSSPIMDGTIGVGAMLHATPSSAVYYDNVVVTFH